MAKRKNKLSEIMVEEEKLAKLKAEYEDLVAKQEEEKTCIGTEIDSLIENKNLFCGIILTEEDLINLIRLKLANPYENIKIKYNLYIEEF